MSSTRGHAVSTNARAGVVLERANWDADGAAQRLSSRSRQVSRFDQQAGGYILRSSGLSMPGAFRFARANALSCRVQAQVRVWSVCSSVWMSSMVVSLGISVVAGAQVAWSSAAEGQVLLRLKMVRTYPALAQGIELQRLFVACTGGAQDAADRPNSQAGHSA